METYNIKLPAFEGPFDLLLFFIERDELDINNIPIAKITDDFLAFIRQAQAMNIDLASEFIVVAATLMRIKAKLLLPRKQVDETGAEIDPRAELVDRLLEYKRYKSVLEEMRRLEEMRSFMMPRGNATAEVRRLAERALAEAEMEDVTLFRLLKTFQRVMSRFEEGSKKAAVHTVYNFNYTIQEQQEFVLSQLERGKKLPFLALFERMENRVHAIVTFLGLLELLNAQQVTLIQGEGANNFWLTTYEEPETEAAAEIPTDVSTRPEKTSKRGKPGPPPVVAGLVALLFLFGKNLSAQSSPVETQNPKTQTQNFSNWSIEVGFHSGRIIKHTQKLHIDNNRQIWAEEIGISYQTTGRREWQAWQHYPEFGLALVRAGFGDGAHGTAFGLVPTLAIPLLFRDDFDIRFRVGTGIGRVERPFDFLTNPNENAIGSHWNNITQFRFTAKWRPGGGRLALVGGGVFTHFSNGGARRPNFGLNLPAFYLGGQFTPVLVKKSAFAKAISSKKPPVHRWGGIVHVGISSSESQVAGGPSYPIYIGGIGVARCLSKINRVFVGLDYERHTAVAWFLAHADGVADEGRYRAASERWLAWAGEEFLFGPLGVNLQLGTSLSGRSRFVPEFICQKFLFRYYLPGIGRWRPWAGVALKTHRFTAEYISASAGIGF